MRNTNDKTEEYASIHLGKKSLQYTEYNPSLLVAVPRCENRKQYEIDNLNLPFIGEDVWHAYEFSALTEHGIPITCVLKLKYSCNNDFLVESKSLKLYLNSFNMSRFGKTTKECKEICKNLIEKDLSKKLQTNVEVEFLDKEAKKVEIFQNFKNIMELVDENKIFIENFKETPEVLETETLDVVIDNYLSFDSLRSNCRVTHQPDFGDAFIYYKSQKHITESSLVKYLCSFRSEYHFHEECCEMIFKRLKDILNENDELFVCALYTRRGGIDICPARWSKNCKIRDIDKLTDLTILARHGIKQ